MEKLALLASIGVADVIGTAAAADDQGSAILIRSCEIFMACLLTSDEFELKFPELSRSELVRLQAKPSLGISIFGLKPS